ncbi:hypothetical protein MTR_8g028305 [Medicago truncatula]|uniref:Uncharacterized protein n=1 Tax=Medicago truncatula TaxID=3880 RepID=A0A072TMW3_MEDTR|nr:hypothetical protein MTR_8g028305 [Medicago truncatula]
MGDIEIEPSSPFIQSPEHIPKSSIIIAEGIPLIDLDYQAVDEHYKDNGFLFYRRSWVKKLAGIAEKNLAGMARANMVFYSSSWVSISWE